MTDFIGIDSRPTDAGRFRCTRLRSQQARKADSISEMFRHHTSYLALIPVPRMDLVPEKSRFKQQTSTTSFSDTPLDPSIEP